MQKKLKYSDEFKREVIEYSLSSPKTFAQICHEFGITTGTFYNWKKLLLGDAESDRSVSEDTNEVSKKELADEVRRLQKELVASKRREESLTQAAIILGETPPNDMR